MAGVVSQRTFISGKVYVTHFQVTRSFFIVKDIMGFFVGWISLVCVAAKSDGLWSCIISSFCRGIKLFIAFHLKSATQP